MGTNTHMHARTYAHTHTHSHWCTHTHTHTHTHKSVCTRTLSLMHTHTHTHTHNQFIMLLWLGSFKITKFCLKDSDGIVSEEKAYIKALAKSRNKDNLQYYHFKIKINMQHNHFKLSCFAGNKLMKQLSTTQLKQDPSASPNTSTFQMTRRKEFLKMNIL